jgi:hypothetical protein
MLGWVPDIESKLAFALRHNTDVHVPMAELMIKRAENRRVIRATRSSTTVAML